MFFLLRGACLACRCYVWYKFADVSEESSSPHLQAVRVSQARGQQKQAARHSVSVTQGLTDPLRLVTISKYRTLLLFQVRIPSLGRDSTYALEMRTKMILGSSIV
jgi:hypothetical protein